MYLYGCEATEFSIDIETQKLFLYERERRCEGIIREIQSAPMGERDNGRLRACIKTRSWVEKMYTELGGK